MVSKVLSTAVCFFGVLIAVQAQTQQAGINQIMSSGSSLPGMSSFPGLPGGSSESGGSGGSCGHEAMAAMMMDHCTWKTMANMAKVMQQSQCSSGGGSSGGGSGGIPGMSNVPGMTNIPIINQSAGGKS